MIIIPYPAPVQIRTALTRLDMDMGEELSMTRPPTWSEVHRNAGIKRRWADPRLSRPTAR